MHTSELTASARAMGPVPTQEGSGSLSFPEQLAPLENRAQEGISPFVKSFSGSPVMWQALDNATIERAKKEHKLIFLHIGYKVCHHCRLMAQESFSNPEVASVLNESFIPIVIDRDERPDLDTIYMNYVQAVSSAGGWPLNLFLTPNLEPVFGGTFWPGPGSVRPHPTADGGDEVLDFLSIINKVYTIWRDQEARCRKEATEVVSQLREFAAEGVLGTRGLMSSQPMTPISSATSRPTSASGKRTVSSEVDLDQLEEAYTHIAGTFDPVYGGFGLRPKFPTPAKLAFLLRLNTFPSEVQDVVGEKECKNAQDMALDTLRKMGNGAMRDHIGGTGFARCSVTPDWSIPNFEKLVVDNALLLSLYLEAWKLSGGTVDSEFFDVVSELIEYLTSAPIALPEGGFASGEAADSSFKRGDREMREGACYVWTRREFDSVVDLGNAQATQVVAAYYGVLEDGNVDEDHDPNDEFINQNIVRVTKTPIELSKQFGLPIDAVEQYIQNAKAALRARREKERPRPEVDDKIVTGWNGLVISSLARAGVAFKDIRPDLSERSLVAAGRAVTFIREKVWDSSSKSLARIYSNGRGGEGLADDYAYLIIGLLDLYDSTQDISLANFAAELQDSQTKLFYDPSGGFYSTSFSAPHTILRLKDGMDTSLPSTNAVSVSNLFRLSELAQGRSDGERYARMARETVDAFEAELLQHPWLYPGLLAGVVMVRLGVERVGHLKA